VAIEREVPKLALDLQTLSRYLDLWVRLDSEAQRQLAEFVHALWTADTYELDQRLPDQLLEQLESAGVIVLDDAERRVIRAELLHFLLARDFVSSRDLAEQPADEILRELKQLVLRSGNDLRASFRDYRQLAAFALTVLVNEHDRQDVLVLIASDQVADQDFWILYDIACIGLPALQIDAEDFVPVLWALEHRTGRDLAGARAIAASEVLGRTRPGFAFELVDVIQEQVDEVYAGYLERLLSGIARSSPGNLNAVIRCIEVWLGCDDGFLCRAAIFVSLRLVEDQQLSPEWLLDKAESLSTRSDNVRFSFAVAVARLGIRTPMYASTCLEVLTDLRAKGPEDGFHYGVAKELSHVKSDADEAALDFTVSCLRFLVNVSEENSGTVKTLGRLLGALSQSRPMAVWQYVEEWILGRPMGNLVSAHDMLVSAIHETYHSDPPLCVRQLTLWFSSADLRLVEQARAVLRELRGDVLDRDIVRAMSEEHVIYVVEKLLVGGLTILQMLRLYYSVIAATSHLDSLYEYFLRVFRHFWSNYPGGSQEFFSNVVDEQDKSHLSDLLQAAQQEFALYQAQREGTFVSELALSQRRVDKYLDYYGKQMRVASEAVFDDERHPFLSLVSRVAVGRGDRTYHMFLDPPNQPRSRTFSEPGGFGHFSESVELPRGEIIDPEGEVWRRYLRVGRTLNGGGDGE